MPLIWTLLLISISSPNTIENNNRLNLLFERLCEGNTEGEKYMDSIVHSVCYSVMLCCIAIRPETLHFLGREFLVPRAFKSVAWFTFSDICRQVCIVVVRSD